MTALGAPRSRRPSLLWRVRAARAAAAVVHWIAVRAVLPHLVVHVWPAGNAGRAHVADDLPAGYGIAILYREVLEVAVGCGPARAQHIDQIAIGRVHAQELDRAAVRG